MKKRKQVTRVGIELSQTLVWTAKKHQSRTRRGPVVSASDEFEFGGILDLLEQQQDLKRILFAFYIFPPES